MSVNITFDPKVNKHEGMTYKDGRPYRTDVAPGAAWYGKGLRGKKDSEENETVENAVLHFACPCGCGACGGLPLTHWQSNGWAWDGNKELPTCTPSVQMLTPCRWHGYLTKGVWRSV